jgi:hypothetical protein
MKKIIKTAVLCSLLIVACLLVGACGGGTEQLARNQGDVSITVTNSSGTPLSGVLIQVRQTASTGSYTNLGTTPASGQLTFTGTADTNYYFTFSKAGSITQTDISRTPQLTSTVDLKVTLI